MKHHVAVKFIAILLCALMLVGAVGSSVGIFVLTELDLYNRPVQDAYHEWVNIYGEMLARQLGYRYAARTLGNAPEALINDRYGNSLFSDIFDWEYTGYRLKDGSGQVLEEKNPEIAEISNRFLYSYDLTEGSYMVFQGALPQEIHYQLQDTDGTYYLQFLEEVPVYVSPTDATEVDRITSGTSLEVKHLEYVDGRMWAYVGNGWVDLDSVSYEGAGAQEAAIAYEPGIYRVNVEQLNVRSAPSVEATVVSVLDRDGEIQIHMLETVDNKVWGFMDQGWVNMRYLTLVDTGEEMPTEEARITVITEENTYLYILPDENSELMAVFDAGVSLPVAYIEVVDGIEWACVGEGFLRMDSVSHIDGTYQMIPRLVDVNENAETIEATMALDVTVPLEEQAPMETGIQETMEPTAAAEETEAPAEETVPEETAVPETVPETVPEEAAPAVAAETDEAEPAEAGEAAEPVAEATAAPEETVPPTEPAEAATEPAEAATEPSTEPEAELAAMAPAAPSLTELLNREGISTYSYFEQGRNMVAFITTEWMPDYTLELYVLPEAVQDNGMWDIIGLVFHARQELFAVLGISVLLFAVLLVYLCCAAGRKPGTTEIRPGGINALPLDLYIGLVIFAVMLVAAGGIYGTMYLIERSLDVGILFGGAMAYLAGLLVVGLLFGCAAQFKTPGGYWWRHSLCGWCVQAMIMVWKWLVKGLKSCWQYSCKGFTWMGHHYDDKLEPGLVRLFKGCWKVILALWGILVKGVVWTVKKLEQGTDWLFRCIGRFFALLPLTWQWIIAGGSMVFFLFMSVSERWDMGMILSILFAFALILYGAHCFGILLESTKRMSKGDLDEKVDDKLMVGAFKEFAQELNGLAGVAVVAAQKQLKSERMKTELITNVSHDIKTPLTSIINYVDLMEKPHSPEEQEVYLEVLSRQSQRLKKLIDDLMEMSKASTGNLAVDIDRVNAVEAVNQALGEFADKLERAQLIPVFRQPEEPVMMMADGRLVWRVMSNLLGNAVKYALPGTRVYLDLLKMDGKVIISIKNISREELNVSSDELLERFVRGDASRNTEGSGLGLNIAQSLMELQKGQLQLLVDGDLFKVTLIFPGA